MANLYPLTFEPIFMERVWGGRTLAELYGKRLPAAGTYGESWEIADRPGAESVIENGPYAGHTLRWLMAEHGAAVTGAASYPAAARFPLLCKILDARDSLSLQVHPSSPSLGEPKTEMWYIARADPGAELFVGLKRGVTRAQFERALEEGSVADCFHRIPVRTGDAMFLPSGRVHAIGAGLVIFEIQQNSDAVFRVFDWNRVGLDGKPRELHIPESLQSIDFDDIEPSLVKTEASMRGRFGVRTLVRHTLFDVDLFHAEMQDVLALSPPRLRIVAVVEGRVQASGNGITVDLGPGRFCLLPASLQQPIVAATHGATFLVVEAGSATASRQ